MTSLFSKQKESVFAPFLRRCKDAGSTFKTTLPPVTLKDPFSPGRAHAPARVTFAVMTPTLSSGTCPLRLHLLLLPLVPDSCRDPLPASASFRPPLREAERRGHTLCTKPSQSPRCSSGGITPPTPPQPRAPTQLAALTFSALTHQACSFPPQACHSCKPLPRRSSQRALQANLSSPGAQLRCHPSCSAGEGRDEFMMS